MNIAAFSSIPDRRHWIDCDVVATIRGQVISTRVRLHLRSPASVITDWPAIETAAIRAARRKAEIHPATPFKRFRVEPVDWSDTIDEAACSSSA